MIVAVDNLGVIEPIEVIRVTIGVDGLLDCVVPCNWGVGGIGGVGAGEGEGWNWACEGDSDLLEDVCDIVRFK